ncbi:MAG TPA: hypothetical protein VIV11_06610 [Kofleriaceae bacterium]
MLRLVAALLALLTIAAPADAEPALVWRAPSGCPSAETARARIEQRLDHTLDTFVVAVTVEISRDADQFVARIVAGPDARMAAGKTVARRLTAATCDELVDAVAIIAARLVRDRAGAVIADPLPGRFEAHAPIDATAPIERRAWQIGVRVSAVSGIGVVPQLGVGAELAIAIRGRALFAELAQTHWLASAIEYDEAARGDVALDVTSTRVGWRSSAVPVRAWLTAEVGTLRAASAPSPTSPRDEMVPAVTLADPATTTRWLAAGAGIGLAWSLGSWIRIVGATEGTLHGANRAPSAATSVVSVRASCGLELGW